MMNHNVYKKFTEKYYPDWICPTCKIGTLPFNSKRINCLETIESRKARDNDGWEPDWITEIYNGVLTCSNPRCKQDIIIVGDSWVGDNNEDNLYGSSDEYKSYYNVKFFHPNLEFFNIPEALAADISEIIQKSFGLFFYSPASSANYARVALEKFLTKIRIKSCVINKNGKRQRLTLHKRIELLPKAKFNKEINLFMAIKWIGNAGSHDDEVTHSNMIDLYSIFDLLLKNIYDDTAKKVSMLANKVVKKKGPVR